MRRADEGGKHLLARGCNGRDELRCCREANARGRHTSAWRTVATMSPDEENELGYHLRELRADLLGILCDLQAASSCESGRVIVRAWIFADSGLEHDFDVHLPRAFELLGSTLPPGPPPEGRRAGNAAVPATMAREARRLLESSLAALPSDVDPPRSAEALRKTAMLMWVARPIVAQALQMVLDSEPPDPEESADGER